MRNRAHRPTAKTRPNISFEPLEQRQLLAATGGRSVFDVRSIPVFEPTSANIADVKNGPMAKAGSALIGLYREYRKSLGTQLSSPLADTMYIDDKQRIMVSVRGRSTLANLTDRMRSLSGQIVYRSKKWNVVYAWLPIRQLHSLCKSGDVLNVNPIYRPITRQQGNAFNQADQAQNADQTRTVYSLDGSGVKIGVISDSVNQVGTKIAGSIATGNLPSKGVQVIADGEVGDSDEGRAMLELIHDIAPGADLAFATCGPTQLTFADNIRALRATGCDIILDDIGMLGEPFFQPGVIDQAITDVTRDGAVYFSAIGNDDDDGFEAPTNFTKLGRDRYVDFNLGSAVDTRMRIEMSGGFFQLQWDNPYNGVVGNVTADLDIYIYDPHYPQRIIASATTNNLQTGLPVETISLPRLGAFDIEIRLADYVPGTSLPTRFKIAGAFGLSSTEYSGIRASARDHAAGEDCISVGAVPFFNAPPFQVDDSAPISSELFSSLGPVTRIFDADGNRLPTPLTLQKPDISAIDNTNTSFFGNDIFQDGDALPNFSGTSAAAPNAAAVAALILQEAPNATAEQIRAALTATARPVNGAAVGEWDPQGGYGLIDALAAVQQFVLPPTVDIVDVSPDPIAGGIDSLKIVFSQQISNFDLSNLVLSRDGGVNLLSGGNDLFTTDGGRTYLLRNLADVTSEPGVYTLELFAEGMFNAANLELQEGATETFTVIDVPPIPAAPSDLKVKVISETEIRLRWTDNSDIEEGFTIQRAEDSRFTANVKTFQVGENVTVFTDKTLLPAGKRFYYRVRAFNKFSYSSQFSSYSNVAAALTFLPGEVVLDNESASGFSTRGSWTTTSAGSGFLGDSFLTTDDNDAWARYTPMILAKGDYYVYARWARQAGNATNVPYDVFYDTGGKKKKTVVVNQNKAGAGWVLLGKFRFEQGTSGFVRLRTEGTNGLVVADAVRFVSSEGVTPLPRPID